MTRLYSPKTPKVPLTKAEVSAIAEAYHKNLVDERGDSWATIRARRTARNRLLTRLRRAVELHRAVIYKLQNAINLVEDLQLASVDVEVAKRNKL